MSKERKKEKKRRRVFFFFLNIIAARTTAEREKDDARAYLQCVCVNAACAECIKVNDALSAEKKPLF